MKIDNALASLPVKDLKAARSWYEKILGRAPDTEPMSELCEWQFPNGGGLQVYVGPERAGGGSCTLPVPNIDDAMAALKQIGIDPGKLIDGGRAKVVMVKDPDGNSIAFAQALDPTLAK